jgi:hypothetical protein
MCWQCKGKGMVKGPDGRDWTCGQCMGVGEITFPRLWERKPAESDDDWDDDWADDISFGSDR